MKLDKRHMAGSLAILASSIVYNVWVFTRPASRPAGNRPPAEILGAAPFEPGGGDARPVSLDPSQVPDLPAVGIDRLPQWPRDPFQDVRERPRIDAVAEPAAPVPVPAPASEVEPVVASILYSTGRRLAVIDGRIVHAGDLVGGATVVEILPKAVILEWRGGEQRTIELQAPATGVVRR